MEPGIDKTSRGSFAGIDPRLDDRGDESLLKPELNWLDPEFVAFVGKPFPEFGVKRLSEPFVAGGLVDAFAAEASELLAGADEPNEEVVELRRSLAELCSPTSFAASSDEIAVADSFALRGGSYGVD